jgi:hypothetical protein
MKKGNEGLKQPFFASFLEGQLNETDQQTVQGGGIVLPPVKPTAPTKDMLHTQKFPSDGDEENGI